MATQEVRRNGLSINLLTDLAVENGMSAEECLSGTRLERSTLADPETQVSAEQELRTIRNILAKIGNLPGLGLDAGGRYHLSTYGIWGFALLSSPTYRSAAGVAERYLDLSYAFVRFRMESRPDSFRVVMDDKDVPEDARLFLIEREFAAWVNATREMQPRGLPIQLVQFKFARPTYVERFVQLCGVEPRFNAADNSVWIDPIAVDAPLPQGDTVVAHMCLEQCRQLLSKRKLRTGVSGRVRDRMFAMIGRIPTIEMIAQDLHMSPRSLRRRLDEEGTSFRALAEEVLQALAEDLLGATTMKLDEVALRLGYSEATGFTHAFKRWTGLSPQAYREARRERISDGA